MLWPEVSRGQYVERQDVGVYDGLISLRSVSNTSCYDDIYSDLSFLNKPF